MRLQRVQRREMNLGDSMKNGKLSVLDTGNGREGYDTN
jgi:hypothetical protein